jgi:hypothetical protein
MPRSRKNDPLAMIAPIIDDFVSKLAGVMERFTSERVSTAPRKNGRRTRKAKDGARSRRVKRCYYPGCRNVAAPRFGMFCAAEHKGLPARDKARYRAERVG